MRTLLHAYLDDPAPTTLHRGHERLVIEAAFLDAQHQHRDRLLSAWRARSRWARRPS